MRTDTRANPPPTRRDAVRLFTTASAAAALAPAHDLLESAGLSPLPQSNAYPACVVVPQQTEGPYFVDQRLRRSDLRADPASGIVKAGVLDQSRRFDTRGQKFLRGYQVTNKEGRAEFTTIYPGWYPGRTVHIHCKIRSSAAAGRAGEFTS